MKCRKHPRYRAKRQPRIACPGCWWKWFHDGYGKFNFLVPKELDFI